MSTTPPRCAAAEPEEDGKSEASTQASSADLQLLGLAGTAELAARRRLRLVALTVCSLGYNIGFGMKYVLLTSFLAQLGVPSSWRSMAWLISPATGMLQPAIGRVSDRYMGRWSTWGRRRPFLALGAGLSVLGHLGLALAVDVGTALGDSAAERARPRAAFLFLAGLSVLELGGNMAAVIHRALIPEITVSEREQFRAFSWTSAWNGAGVILANVLTSVPWDRIPGFESRLHTESCGAAFNCANIKMSFLLAAVLSGISAAVTCLFTREAPARRAPCTASARTESLRIALRDPTICGTYLVTAAAWGGWIALQVYGSHFCAEEVFLGSPDPRDLEGNRRYVEGSRAAGTAMAANTLLMILASFGLSSVTGALGRRAVWSGSALFAGLWLCACVPIRRSHSTWGVQAWLALFGPAFAVQCSLPYSLIASQASPQLKGTLLGYLNWAVCFPQLVLSLTGGPLVSAFGTDVAAFLFGALCFLLAGLGLWAALPSAVDADAASRSSSGSSTPRRAGAALPGPRGAALSRRTPRPIHTDCASDSDLSAPLLKG